jgi:hypothetical protein
LDSKLDASSLTSILRNSSISFDFTFDDLLIQTIFKSFNIEYGKPFTLQNYSNNINYSIKFINDMIPSTGTYDSIISHDDKKPKITSIDAYNKFCEDNENRYLENFIKCLYP